MAETNLLIETVRQFERKPDVQKKAGEVIFRQGDAELEMFGLLSGEVEMFLGRQLIETIQAGEIFGVGAIVHADHLRASTAIAKTDCVLAVLDREHFLFAVQQTPMFALEVMQSYSDRYRRLKSLYEAAIAPRSQG